MQMIKKGSTQFVIIIYFILRELFLSLIFSVLILQIVL